MIALVDSGRGNLLSVRNALHYLGADVDLADSPDVIDRAERVVLPGVGAFAEGMAHLRARGLDEALHRVHAAGRPILAVCLGMQLLARSGDEGGPTAGLGWIAAEVRRLPANGNRIPHTGWNDVRAAPGAALFENVPVGADFYFVHSYHVVCEDPEDVAATVDYGGPVAAALQRENVAATQFHPEKSQEHGLAVLDSFLRWNP